MTRIPRWPIVTGSVVGMACTVVGLRALGDHVHDVPPHLVVRWLLGLTLAHDLVLVPFVLAVGAALRRWVPTVVRAEVAGALIVSGAVVLEAWPAWRGYGRLHNNPSVLPRNYGVGLAVTLACVWAIAALIAAARIVRRR